MNREEIISMAREARLERNGYWEFDLVRLERFFALASEAGAAAEREACAKVCEDIDEYEHEEDWATWCAEAIRARGNT